MSIFAPPPKKKVAFVTASSNENDATWSSITCPAPPPPPSLNSVSPSTRDLGLYLTVACSFCPSHGVDALNRGPLILDHKGIFCGAFLRT